MTVALKTVWDHCMNLTEPYGSIRCCAQVTSSISPQVRLKLGSVRVRVVTEPNPN